MQLSPTPLALYIHWPFCVSKCPYCDFNSHVRAKTDIDTWRKALLADLAYEAKMFPERELGSIFFGGGTPSLMPPDLVADLIQAAKSCWQPTPDLEITLEANPSSVEAANFEKLSYAGVNRISLGIQSLNDETLSFLGRAHTANEAQKAIKVATSTFARVNLDFIYALPKQNVHEWEVELNRAIDFGTGHLSLYQLTIEPGTQFATKVAKREWQPLDPDTAADFYELTAKVTESAGFVGYETSNYAKAGQESRHNLTYWRYGDYAGIGPGAHGRRNGTATLRHKKPENYLAASLRNGHGISEENGLSVAECAREALVMGLRLSEGVDLLQLESRFGFSPDDLLNFTKVEALAKHGLIKMDGERLTVLKPGRLLLDAILAEIVKI